MTPREKRERRRANDANRSADIAQAREILKDMYMLLRRNRQRAENGSGEA